MAKRLLYIFLLAPMLMFVAPATVSAESSDFAEMQMPDEVTVSVNQNVIHVTGASGEVMHVYNVTGVEVYTARVDGQDKRFSVNLPKGCYIIKVGKVVRKVYIK